MVFAHPSRYSVLVLAVLLVTTAARSCRAHATHNVPSIGSGSRDLNRELTATGLAGDTNGLNKVQLVSSGNAPRRAGALQIEPQDSSDDQGKVRHATPVQDEAPHKVSSSMHLQLQGSGVISSAPAAESAFSLPSLWDVMLKNGCGRFAELVTSTGDAGCGRFAELVTSTGDAGAAYNKSIHGGGGLTVFCPADKAMQAFNAHEAGARLKLVLLYHAVQAHYSIRALKVNNGAMSTLAADGNTTYNLIVDNDGDYVTLLSAARKAAIVVRTLMDDSRLVVHMIDAVLLPSDFAQPGPADAPSGGTVDIAGDDHQNGGATRPPSLAAFVTTAGGIAFWVLLVCVSTF